MRSLGLDKTRLSPAALGRTLKWTAVLLGLSSILSRLLGVLRDATIAHIFGLGESEGIFALDAYYAAFRIPDLLYNLLILGALSAAFIPLYTEVKEEEGLTTANQFASQIFKLLFAFMAGALLILFFLLPWLIPLLTPGFSAANQDLTLLLSRILFLSPLFFTLSALSQGIENVFKSFWGTALAPLVYNLSIIIAALLWGNEHGVYALAWGAVGGSFLHFLVQIPGLWRTPFRWDSSRPSAKLLSNKKWIKDFFHLALPRILGTSSLQITLLMDTFLCSLLPLGALSVYSYAYNLQSFPYGVIGISLSTALFATLAQWGAQKNFPALVNTLRGALTMSCIGLLPATVGLFLLREPLIEWLLQRGAFSAEATEATATVLGIWVWAALPQGLIPLWARAFYSLKDTRIPVAIALFTMGLNVTLSLLFTQVYAFSVEGLAYANLIASLVQVLLLHGFFARKLHLPLATFFDWKTVIKTLLSTSLMGLGVLWALNQNHPNEISRLFLPMLLGVLIYGLLMRKELKKV